MKRLLNAVSSIALIALLHQSGIAQEAQRGRSGNQGKIAPSMSELMEMFDKNEDGALSKDEVQRDPFKKNFASWDSDGDGSASKAEILAFRKRFGIDADGNQAGGRRRMGRPGAMQQFGQPKLTIPDIKDMHRVGPKSQPSAAAMRNSAFVMQTESHQPLGEAYVILTDHDDPAYLKPLQTLADYRKAKIITVENLAELHTSAAAMAGTSQQMRDLQVGYVALAPKLENFTENTLLTLWELLSGLDADPLLDAYPGVLLSSSPEEFAQLIDRSITHESITQSNVQPFAISQVNSTRELRSLQKSGILRNLFASYDIATPTVGIYGPAAKTAPTLEGDRFWRVDVQGKQNFVKEFEGAAGSSFAAANLLIMHGHGIPGMSCSVDVEAIPDDTQSKIVLCGSCFSAAPKNSCLPAMREAPGGYAVAKKEAFAIRAVDNGATVVFGHMRLNQGFPHLYPVLEGWMHGKTVGQCYQELINALITKNTFKSGEFIITDDVPDARRPPQNILLYTVFGDPALQPMQAFEPGQSE